MLSFTSSSQNCLQEFQVPEIRGKVRSKDLPLLEADRFREHLKQLDAHKYMGLDGIQLLVLRELSMSL